MGRISTEILKKGVSAFNKGLKNSRYRKLQALRDTYKGKNIFETYQNVKCYDVLHRLELKMKTRKITEKECNILKNSLEGNFKDAKNLLIGKFWQKSGYALVGIVIGLMYNYDKIKSAKETCGNKAMFEQIGKTAFMCGILGKLAGVIPRTIDNIGRVIATYSKNDTVGLNALRTGNVLKIGGIFVGISLIKKLFDKFWVTKYEQFAQNQDNINSNTESDKIEISKNTSENEENPINNTKENTKEKSEDITLISSNIDVIT